MQNSFHANPCKSDFCALSPIHGQRPSSNQGWGCKFYQLCVQETVHKKTFAQVNRAHITAGTNASDRLAALEKFTTAVQQKVECLRIGQTGTQRTAPTKKTLFLQREDILFTVHTECEILLLQYMQILGFCRVQWELHWHLETLTEECVTGAVQCVGMWSVSTAIKANLSCHLVIL